MSKQSKSSPIPNPPKSIGLSRRLVIAVVSMMLLVMVLFLAFLKHYSPKETVIKASDDNAVIDQEASSAQIAKIQQTTHRSVLVDSNKADHSHQQMISKSPAAAESEIGLEHNNALQQGSDAAISVYRNPAMDVASPLENHNHYGHDPSPSINGSGLPSYSSQNNQSEKLAFLNQANRKSDDMIQSRLQKPQSPYGLKAGTIIPATLVTAINSSLPGTIIAKVRRDVFDTATGNYCLIPQGTTLIGQYDSQIAHGQSRVLIVWSRLIFPNGNSFDLRGMPGVDLRGMAGLHDKVDNHYFKVFGNALLFSLFGAVGQLSQPKSNTNQLTTQQILTAAIGQQMNQTAMQLIEKDMTIEPTLTIRAGTTFNVLLTKDMVLPSAYQQDGQ